MKKCTKCHELKPTSGYSKQQGAKDGLYPLCKQCVAEQHKQYRQEGKPCTLPKSREHHEERLAKKETLTHKVCKLCKNNLPIDLFYKKYTAADGHTTHCKLCLKKIRPKRVASTV